MSLNQKTAATKTDILSLTLDIRLERRSFSWLDMVRPALQFDSFMCGTLGLPVVDDALTLYGEKVQCRSPRWLQTNTYRQEGTMQAPLQGRLRAANEAFT